MKWHLAIGAGAALIAASAQANVVYNWQPTSQGEYLGTASGKLVVTNAAYRSGSIAIDYTGSGRDDIHFKSPDNLTITNSPISELSMTFNGPLAHGMNLPAKAWPGDKDFVIYNELTADLSFDRDGLLSGRLFSYPTDTEYNASGNGTHWSVSNVGSDRFTSTPCGPPECDAGTGYWQVDNATLPHDVPEPPVWALFGLATLGLFLRRRA